MRGRPPGLTMTAKCIGPVPLHRPCIGHEPGDQSFLHTGLAQCGENLRINPSDLTNTTDASLVNYNAARNNCSLSSGSCLLFTNLSRGGLVQPQVRLGSSSTKYELMACGTKDASRTDAVSLFTNSLAAEFININSCTEALPVISLP